jgi:arylsulfatase
VSRRRARFDAPDRTTLPIPDPPFTGVAGLTLEESRADWGITEAIRPPEGVPNIMLVVIDDGEWSI